MRPLLKAQLNFCFLFTFSSTSGNCYTSGTGSGTDGGTDTGTAYCGGTGAGTAVGYPLSLIIKSIGDSPICSYVLIACWLSWLLACCPTPDAILKSKLYRRPLPVYAACLLRWSLYM